MAAPEVAIYKYRDLKPFLDPTKRYILDAIGELPDDCWFIHPVMYEPEPGTSIRYFPDERVYRRDFFKWLRYLIFEATARIFVLDMYYEVHGDGTLTVEEIVKQALIKLLNRDNLYYNLPNSLELDFSKVKADVEAIGEVLKNTYRPDIEVDLDRLSDVLYVPVTEYAWVAFYYEPKPNFYDPESPLTVTSQRPLFDQFESLWYLLGGYAGTNYFSDLAYCGDAFTDEEYYTYVLDGGEASSVDYLID